MSLDLDAFVKPPESLRLEFKRWQKQKQANGPGLTDLANLEISPNSGWIRRDLATYSALKLAFQEFCHDYPTAPLGSASRCATVFESTILPGLYVYPSLLPQHVQVALLDRLLHRDLCNPVHQTNLHLHYKIDYPSSSPAAPLVPCSFFGGDHEREWQPRDPNVHRPITVEQALEKKLRWVTLGGQYDWTKKVYPTAHPPTFPQDIRELLHSIFPEVDAQAAILNFYSPGDTLSLHRDVSEECNAALISVSIGCDGIFIVGNEDGSRSVTMKLRSGDAILMSQDSRFAWHGVPRVIAESCPESLQAWPCLSSDTPFSHWKGWLKNKRINLNIRQMSSTTT